MTTPRPEFVYSIYIQTTPEKLFAALTRGEFTRQFWGLRSIQSDWKKGSPVRMTSKSGNPDWSGVVLEHDPPRRLSYTFQDEGRFRAEGATRVVFELEPRDSAVLLTITHDHFPPDSKLLPGVSGGWPAILSSLKTLLETGTAIRWKEWE